MKFPSPEVLSNYYTHLTNNLLDDAKMWMLQFFSTLYSVLTADLVDTIINETIQNARSYKA